ncbi:hypothetical protein BDQ17DRAFT_161918 [Cyathus striatus]|nr:hypothetical protein BDQ17DRAFT_161918 [Cyathus striatus]
MASPTVMRATLKSPARATFAKSSLKVPRSILKRPAPLALSPNPFPFSSSFTLQLSPANPSPHVHFPPSPTLFAMFTAHSPGTYDRAPIIVSPNPLALPDWGDRIYSPTLNGFKAFASPQPFPMSIYNSPTIAGFEDPRSPKESIGRQRLISFASQPSGRRSHELAKALSKYPRSPYPSAPISPAEFEDPGGEDVSRGRKQYRERGDMIKSLPARARARARSVEEQHKQKRQVTPLNVAPKQFKAGLLSPFMPAPSPLSQTFLTANQEPTLARANKPPPLPLMVEPVSSNLTQAFWQSVSLEDTETMPSPAFPES